MAEADLDARLFPHHDGGRERRASRADVGTQRQGQPHPEGRSRLDRQTRTHQSIVLLNSLQLQRSQKSFDCHTILHEIGVYALDWHLQMPH